MKSYIPNSITLFNLLCGSITLVCIFYHEFQLVFLFMLMAFLADWFDGLAARWLEVNSPVGKELDSLADMVSFGLVPGAMIYVLLANSLNGGHILVNDLQFAALPAFLITVFSAIRLARFNIDTRQKEGFLGLATPAATGFVLGVYLIYYYDSMGLRELVGTPWLLYLVCILISFLLVCEIPMFSFKYKHMSWKGNEVRLTYVIIGIVLLLTLNLVALPLLVLLYVAMSIGENIFSKNSNVHEGAAEVHNLISNK